MSANHNLKLSNNLIMKDGGQIVFLTTNGNVGAELEAYRNDIYSSDYIVMFHVPAGLYGYILNSITFQPNYNGVTSLGTASAKWKDIYAQNGTIQTSDRNKKTDIAGLPDDLIKDFIMGLHPSSYKMADGTSGRTHWGIISQDIEELMERLGMESKDFAGFIKSPRVIRKYEDKDGKPLEEPIEETIEGEYEYSLRYDEFIAPIIIVEQMHDRRLDEMEERIEGQQVQIDALKAENEALKNRMGKIENMFSI